MSRTSSAQAQPLSTRHTQGRAPKNETTTLNRLLLTMPFGVPAYWTPEQALAVVELLDDLSKLIWAHYGMQLRDDIRENLLRVIPTKTRC
jgi:hypothetical protein